LELFSKLLETTEFLLFITDQRILQLFNCKGFTFTMNSLQCRRFKNVLIQGNRKKKISMRIWEITGKKGSTHLHISPS
jgi:hypothetical protein